MKNWKKMTFVVALVCGVLLAVVLLLRSAGMVSGDGPKLAEPSQLQISTADGVSMHLVERSGVHFVLRFENQTQEEAVTGWGCTLEKRENGIWYAMESEDVAFTAEGYLISPQGTLDWEEDVGYFGRELSPGEYRIMKTVYCGIAENGTARNLILAAEFVVE